VVAGFGGAIAISEWHQLMPVGTPRTFTLTLSLPSTGGAPPSTAIVDAVIADVTATKPLGSHFDFVMAQNAAGSIGLRGLARPALYARLGLVVSSDPTPPPPAALTLGGFTLTLGGVPLTIGT
jgi:P2-related tail formation protein